ncbi:hypothetical protein SAMN05216464_111125 [Mucilaginibacter pineti]|uniref:Uncharacterized protein n=1 Tax=Mucilaginibacter pineti TaxID=1391627 RepID=A0A1G7H9H4_9SPHI|nr:hypothetical protein SAMN05216464_111125 [Mucilaginibacter pineti]
MALGLMLTTFSADLGHVFLVLAHRFSGFTGDLTLLIIVHRGKAVIGAVVVIRLILTFLVIPAPVLQAAFLLITAVL